MKKPHSPIAFAILMLALGPLSNQRACAQEGKVYFRAGGGVALAKDVDLKQFFNEPVAGSKIKFDTGFNLDLAGGYQIMDWLGAELESGFIYNSVKSVTGTADTDLSISQVPLLLNVVLRYPNKTGFVPYIGAGGGGTLSLLNGSNFRLGNTSFDGTESDFVSAYQGFAGVQYNFSDRMSLGFSYKYLVSGESEWKPDILLGTSGTVRVSGGQVQSLVALFRFSF